MLAVNSMASVGDANYNITYEGQLSLKTQKVKDVIERIGHQNQTL